MGVVLTEGWDYYWDARTTPNGAQAVWVKGFLDQNLVFGRYGGYCFEHTRAGGTENIAHDFPDGNVTTGTLTVRFDFQCTNLLTRQILILNPNASTTEQFSIWQHADGAVSLRNGGTTLASSAAGVLAINTWYFIEAAVTISNTGSFEIRVDTVNVVSGSGDTMGAANANTGRITLPEPLTSGTMRYDNLSVSDTITFLGPCEVIYRRPLAVVPGGDFNMTATSVYAYPLLVDEHATDTVSYITGSAANDEQYFTHENLSTRSGTDVFAINLLAFGRTDAGTATADPIVHSNGDTTTGASWSFDTTFRFRRRVVANDPDTGLPWTRAALAAMDAGLKITAFAGGAASLRLSQFGYEALVPAPSTYAEAGGHRYWRLAVLTNNSGSRPGTWMFHMFDAANEYLRPHALTGTGGLWAADSGYVQATNGRVDTLWLGGTTINANTMVIDYGGPVIPIKFWLGSAALASESIRTYTIDYSDDGVTWTTLYTELTPQVSWAVPNERREFILPGLPSTSGRRRQSLVLN